MVTFEQMTATAIPFVTQAGAQYNLPRLTLKTRRLAIQFVLNVEEIKNQSGNDSQAIDALFDELASFLTIWLDKLYPGITHEQIEEDWDLADIPELNKIILNLEAGIQEAIPPGAAPASRRKK
ncbi:hypothetical protein LLG39_12620 [bacterium]|nr:hypothetical protein [bacterium]